MTYSQVTDCMIRTGQNSFGSAGIKDTIGTWGPVWGAPWLCGATRVLWGGIVEVPFLGEGMNYSKQVFAIYGYCYTEAIA